MFSKIQNGSLKLPKKTWFTEIFKQFWVTVSAKLQLDGYEWGYFHIEMEYYCLDENHASGTLSSRFTGCQNPYQLQNLKIMTTFQGHKNPHEQNFWNLNFFISEKTRLHRCYQNKNQLVVTSSSYIKLTMKLLINRIY